MVMASILFSLCGASVDAQNSRVEEESGMGRWVAMSKHQRATIEPGTTITVKNWRQYEQFMPLGMIELFEGHRFWKMPQNVEIDVGPTVMYPLPKGYVDATEKYSGQVRVLHLHNGHNEITNYVGGEPFPRPEEPEKGYKLLVDLWYAYAPSVVAGTPLNPLHSCTQDRFGSITCNLLSYVYRQTAYNTDPGVPRDDPRAKDVWFTEWAAIEEPEQSKYTAQLTLFFKNNQRNEELYLFVPSLRRSLRLGVAARCAPVAGSDYLQDDYKSIGFNGGIALFDAQFLGRRKILALTGNYKPLGGDFPNRYLMPLGWPTPAWGKWQVRAVDVIDVRRVPSERRGYCYGKRIIYADASNHYALWEDIYDSNMNLWKVALAAQRVINASSLGYVPGPVTADSWDIQNNHMTNASTQDKYGHDLVANSDVPSEYQDFAKYATPAGLAQIMK
jgi:hypothetical protein